MVDLGPGIQRPLLNYQQMMLRARVVSRLSTPARDSSLPTLHFELIHVTTLGLRRS